MGLDMGPASKSSRRCSNSLSVERLNRLADRFNLCWGALGGSRPLRLAARAARGRNREHRTGPRPPGVGARSGASARMTIGRAGLTSAAFTRPGCRGEDLNSPQGFCCALDSAAPAATRAVEKRPGHRVPPPDRYEPVGPPQARAVSPLLLVEGRNGGETRASCRHLRRTAEIIEHASRGLLRQAGEGGSVIELASAAIWPLQAMAPSQATAAKAIAAESLAGDSWARLGAKGHRCQKPVMAQAPPWVLTVFSVLQRTASPSVAPSHHAATFR